MRYLPRALLAGGIGFAVSLLAACGGGPGLLSGQQASQLQAELDQVSSAVANHNCRDQATKSLQLSNSVQNLPGTINSTLRSDLENGVSVASSNASKDCQPTTTTSTSTTSSTTTSTPSTTATTRTTTTTTATTTTPTTSTTTATTTTPTTTTPTTPTTTSPSGGGGLGGGGGGGNGQ